MSYNPHIVKPHYAQTSWGQRFADKLFGTNYQGQADAYNRVQDQLAANKNQYEYQKANLANQYDYYRKTQADNYLTQQAINQNKYSWNVQGMTQAGINPIAAMGNVGNVAGTTTGAGASVSGAQGSAAGGMSQGDVGEVTHTIMSGVKDMLHEISPASMLRAVKHLI